MNQYKGRRHWSKAVVALILIAAQMMATDNTFEILDLGFFKPQMTPTKQLNDRSVGRRFL